MLIYPCTKICMYCCYDPTTQSNGLRPNLVSTAEAWIPEKQFRDFATLARPACLAHVLRGQLTKFTRQQSRGTVNIQRKLKPQTCFTCTNRLITYHRFTFRSWTLMRKYYSKNTVKNCGNSPQSALDDSPKSFTKYHKFSPRCKSGSKKTSPRTSLSATSACPKPQRPRPGLLQLALLGQEHGQVVQPR